MYYFSNRRSCRFNHLRLCASVLIVAFFLLLFSWRITCHSERGMILKWQGYQYLGKIQKCTINFGQFIGILFMAEVVFSTPPGLDRSRDSCLLLLSPVNVHIYLCTICREISSFTNMALNPKICVAVFLQICIQGTLAFLTFMSVFSYY